MLGMLSYFEVVGRLVKRRYVLLADIDGLFRGTILDVGTAYVLHINGEQQKRGVLLATTRTPFPYFGNREKVPSIREFYLA